MNLRSSGVRTVFVRSAGALLLVLAFSAGAVHAATPDLATYADQTLAAAFPADQPGAAALVMKDGKVVLRKGYGLANLELGVPVSPDMVFELGSITKQFTAASILLLQERGQLRVEDEITKYLPDYPTHGQKITIEHLLTHTSGVPSYTGMAEWRPRVREDMKLQDLIAIFKDKPLDFNPGEQWNYSNSGYILLGAIVEKVAGKSYEQFVEEEIFQKLGMVHSRYGHAEEIVPLRATGYAQDGKGFRNADYLSMTQPYAAGSLMSTVDDLAIWGRALESEALLKKASLDRMFTAFHLKSGASTHYGYGIAVSDFEGERVVEHGGGIFGFVTHMARIPEEHVFVAILSNNEASDPDPGALALRILAKGIGKAIEDRKTVALDAKTLDEYVGVYRFDEDTTRAVTRAITREGSKLFSQRSGGNKSEILASARDEFFYPDGNSRLHFRRDAQGKVTGADFITRNSPDAAGTKTNEPLPQERQAIKLDPAIYDAYVGDYELAPSFSIAITREGGQIFAQATGQAKLEIFPESETRFFYKVVDAQIELVRGADGKVTGLVLHQGGRDMPGKRK
jgi:CubicO group peptidase (beta-lactamase class C family)